MRVAILQPSYLPWLGYFEQMDHVDRFVFLDDVQYTRSDWRNRNRVKTPRGPCWLTVPVRRLGLRQRICDAQIDYNAPWPEHHLNVLRENYRKARYFGEVIDLIAPRLLVRPPLLRDLNEGLVLELASYIGIKTETMRSSDLNVVDDDPNRRLVRICQLLGATEMYEGAAGVDYMDVGMFEAAGVRIVFQHYQHPTYEQFFGPFVSHLSIVDLLFHHGSRCRDVVVAGHSKAAAAPGC